MRMLVAGKIKKFDSKILTKIKKDLLTPSDLRWNQRTLYDACERLVKRIDKESYQKILLKSGEALSKEEASSIINEICTFISRDSLSKKVVREFGLVDPFAFRKLRDGDSFETWSPLGVIAHIVPSNAPALPFLAAIEGLLTGNINLIKMSSNSSEFTLNLLADLAKEDDEIAKRLYLFPISSKDKVMLSEFILLSDGVSAWGSEEAINSIRELTPSHVRFISWGHKISFSYVTKLKLDDPLIFYQLAYSVCENDQQACSSPQTIFVESSSWSELLEFSQRLANSLKKISPKIPRVEVQDSEAAEITKVTNVHRTESFIRESKVFEAKDHSWRVLVENEDTLRASPLFRTIFVKPLKKVDIIKRLHPMRSYLQTVGLSCSRSEVAPLITLFEKAGVTRVRALDGMLRGYEGEPHDGEYALLRFVKRVSAELADLKDVTDLSELTVIPPVKSDKAVLKKDDFQETLIDKKKAELFFKSGGSSGEPKLSVFTYEDYHTQMRYAGDGLVAAGLDPKNDLVMNLFFAGGLYGGFLSFFTILEDLRVKQFPMAAHMDYKFVGKMIVDHNINVILGMPTYIEHLFRENESLFKSSQTIKKIFYGGEHFTKAQKMRYRIGFGIELIRSATYGSVDAGPLGYQCIHSEGSEHHLHSELQSLEILNLDSDTPAKAGDIGRLIFTSKRRSSMSIERYEIGDLGRLLPPCACGRGALYFELLGRHGDIFRAGGSFLNYNRFQKILEEHFTYSDELQFFLDTSNGKDSLTLYLSERFTGDPQKSVELLCREYPDFAEIITEKSMRFKIEMISSDRFVKTEGSGKLKRVIDQRKL